eukprot:COSAG06_NODE_510_length_14871_cov_12.799824_3_plen_545_part_00
MPPSADQARFLPNPKEKDDSVGAQFARLESMLGKEARQAAEAEAEEGADDETARLTAGIYDDDDAGTTTAAEAGGGSALGDVRRVCVLAAPIILSNITVPLTGAVDIAIVGRLGEAAFLGGVAVGTLLFNYVYWGLGFVKMGTTGLTANAFGACTAAGSSASDRQRAREQLLIVLVRALMMAVVFGGLVLLASEAMLRLLFALIATTPTVQRLGTTYFRARVIGAPAALSNLAVMGWLLGVQEPKSCLAINIVINSANILLDWVLALQWGWGIAGVGYATAAAQYAGLAVSAAAVCRLLSQPRFAAAADPAGPGGGGSGGGGGGGGAGLSRRAWCGSDGVLSDVFDWSAIRRTMAVNGDIFIRTICLLTAFAYITSQSAQLGEVVLAANSVLDQFGMLAAFLLDGFANAAEALVGEAFGAKDRRALRRHIRAACGAAALVAGVVSSAWWVGGEWLIALLTTIPEVRAMAADYLPYVIAAPLVSVWAFMLDGIFIGAVATAEMRNAMIIMLVLAVGVGELLIPLGWGIQGCGGLIFSSWRCERWD